MAVTKKTTKVQTPIDERETFVSLQKTFAESEQSVQEKLKTLYELQMIDNDIDKLVQFRGELPKEVASLEQEIADFNAKSEKINQMIEGYNQTIAAAQEAIVEFEAEIAKYSSQLENISNSREYDSVNKELENLNLLKDIQKKNIFESKMAIEDRKKDLERIADRVVIREADLAAKQEELVSIVGSTAKEEKALVAQRELYVAKLDERTVNAYDHIRKSTHNHLAVVTLFPKNEDGTYGNACGGCYHTITPQRILDVASCKKLVICEHCGRIIVNPEI